MENKINKEDMEKASNQHTEMLADETYASKIKNKVDQHLTERHGSQISRVNTRIGQMKLEKKPLQNRTEKTESAT